MRVLLLSTLFILTIALAYREPGFCTNCPSRPVACYYNDSFAISRALSPSLEKIPSLFLCANRRMRLSPRVKLNLGMSLLLLLAGDVSLNPGPVRPNLRLATINARSMRDKAPALSDLVVSKGIDLLGITETWLTTGETSGDLAEMTPHGFSFLQIPRVKRRGGGVGLFISNDFQFTPVTLPSQSSFESISGRLECGRSSLNILNIYRPPGPASSFFSELQDVLFYMASLPQDLIVMGDFNLHIESLSPDVRQLTCILESFDLNQHVNFPTHIHGHSLDVMIFSKGCDVLSITPSDAISDHFSVIADLKIPTDHSHTTPQTITYRKLKAINMEAFKADIKTSDLINNPKSNATELAQQYDSVLTSLINLHAPLVTKTISPKPPNPWMTPAILASKRHRRYLERVWRRFPTALNRSRLTKQIHLCNRLMSKAKSAHYSKIISEHSGDHRSLWQAFNKILHRCPKMHLPNHSSIAALANTFSSFFINKISIIRSSFPTDSCPNVVTPPNTRGVLQNLTPATEDEVRRIVLSAPCKSSDLDPIPTSLVKDCIEILVTPIVSIVNLSLSEGCFPSHFKSALVSPLLKKPTLNKDDMKNYRPVSNLSFLSKILEKVVASRLNSHINSSHISNHYQSAYRKLHSTETAFLKFTTIYYHQWMTVKSQH